MAKIAKKSTASKSNASKPASSKPNASKSTKSAAKQKSVKAAAQSEFNQLKKRQPFTVFLIIDDGAVRSSLAGFLRQQKLEVHDYMTAMEFYRDYRTPVPGVLVSEVHLRDMSGIELFQKLTGQKSDLLVGFLAGQAEAPLAVHGMKSGAIDFVTKPVTENNLMALVARAYAVYYDVDWDFVGEDLDDVEMSMSRLTTREKETLNLVADGLSSRDISEKLGISVKTVEAHRSRIHDKMRADDLPHLIRMVMAYNEEQDA